jgi:hypothetical protein
LKFRESKSDALNLRIHSITSETTQIVLSVVAAAFPAADGRQKLATTRSTAALTKSTEGWSESVFMFLPTNCSWEEQPIDFIMLTEFMVVLFGDQDRTGASAVIVLLHNGAGPFFMFAETLWSWFRSLPHNTISATLAQFIANTQQAVSPDLLLRLHGDCGALRLHGVSLLAIVVVLMAGGHIDPQSGGTYPYEVLEPRATINATEINALVQKLYAAAKLRSPKTWTGQPTHAMLLHQHISKRTDWPDCPRCLCLLPFRIVC